MQIIEDHLMFKEPTALGGIRYVFSFPNGYSAEVIRDDLTLGGIQGLWEVRYLPPDDKTVRTEGYCTTSEANDILRDLKGRGVHYGSTL